MFGTNIIFEVLCCIDFFNKPSNCIQNVLYSGNSLSVTWNFVVFAFSFIAFFISLFVICKMDREAW